MPEWIGYRWLAEQYGVDAVQAFRTDSAIGKSRATVRENGYVHELYPPAARPAASLAGHLTFALKHEGVHLEFLARLFDVASASELEAWVGAEPTGQYARRACFFHKYLTGRMLDFPGVAAGNYAATLTASSARCETTAAKSRTSWRRSFPHWPTNLPRPNSPTHCTASSNPHRQRARHEMSIGVFFYAAAGACAASASSASPVSR